MSKQLKSPLPLQYSITETIVERSDKNGDGDPKMRERKLAEDTLSIVSWKLPKRWDNHPIYKGEVSFPKRESRTNEHCAEKE